MNEFSVRVENWFWGVVAHTHRLILYQKITCLFWSSRSLQTTRELWKTCHSTMKPNKWNVQGLVRKNPYTDIKLIKQVTLCESYTCTSIRNVRWFITISLHVEITTTCISNKLAADEVWWYMQWLNYDNIKIKIIPNWVWFWHTLRAKHYKHPDSNLDTQILYINS